MPWTGAYYTWTNKTIWSKIDRVFINDCWHDVFYYTIAKYLSSGLSDHAPVIIQFPDSPRPKPQFQFYEMWIKYREFHKLIDSIIPDSSNHKMLQLNKFLSQLRPLLMHLNRHSYADLKLQQVKARAELDTIQEHYIEILLSSADLIKQQCKIDWLTQGDEYTRFFFAKAKQRKLATYIYTIKNTSNTWVEGFDQHIYRPQKAHRSEYYSTKPLLSVE
ncbi:hypothetical protein Cgig2_013561 [Carnegiea gigantea]|uniref:Reverse transcriptase n=1 Tax=Carnegiea gigantea TaxID=171969 RepID=A0A9Q1JG80_9CARY|nr:hypothetical protein Cgig2_013561 [Carnegiea gigantea]